MNIIIQFKALPKPIRISSVIYVSCLLGYNIYGSYTDAKQVLLKYRTYGLENLSSLYKSQVTDEWGVVKLAASVNSWPRFWNSLVWPIMLTKNIVPSVVLALNPKGDKENDKKDEKKLE